MAFQEQLLAQLAPTNTNATSIYTPNAGETTIIRTILVCNTTGSTAAFRIFLDDDGTTYSAATALYYDVDVATKETVEINLFLAMADSDGNLAVRTGTADALTFTVFGAVLS